MSVFNWKVQNMWSFPQETQQKHFKLIKSSKGELTLGPPRKNLQQWINGRRHFLNLVVLILNTYGDKQSNMAHVCQSLSAPLLDVLLKNLIQLRVK